jgi:hypothetical protein
MPYLKYAMKPTVAAIIVWSQLVCLPVKAQTKTAAAEERISQLDKKKAQTVDYLNGLAAAVHAEKRNNAWATKKEAELVASYGQAKDTPSNGLKLVNCRSSKCALELQVNTDESPEVSIAQQIAINQWIAESQSCGYTITTVQDLQLEPATGSVCIRAAMR